MLDTSAVELLVIMSTSAVELLPGVVRRPGSVPSPPPRSRGQAEGCASLGLSRDRVSRDLAPPRLAPHRAGAELSPVLHLGILRILKRDPFCHREMRN